MSYKFNPFSRKPDYYESGTTGSVDDVARDNIVNLAWRLAIAEGLSVFNLEDGVVDEFEDETGVDTVNSLNENYNSTDDYYSPASGAIDLMEYASDALAQAAYVTDATYGADLLPTNGTGITSSTEYSTYYDQNSCDDNDGTAWVSTETTNGWVQVDCGEGVTKRIQQITIKPSTATGFARCKNWELHASTDNFSSSDVTLTSGQHANNTNVETYSFSNQTSYRYYRLKILDEWQGAQYVGIIEWELKELPLQSYSESTIKTQGSYSLKGVAAQTDSLNKTLTKTFSSPIDLSGVDSVTFQIRSNRTGSNIKVGIHDSGGTTTEVTPNILSADTFQEVTIDLSGVADANKDAIDSLIVTIVNADAANTFYMDDFSGPLANMTLISNSKEAEAEPTEARFLALVEPVDAITVNTDLLAYISNDGGSNYDAVTLTDEGYFDDTKKILAGNVTLTDRSDQTMVQKIVTANNKDLKVHAWGLLWS